MQAFVTLVIAAIFVGAVLPFQAGMNAQFGRAAGNGWYAAIWNFVVGLLVLSIIVAIQFMLGRIKSGPNIEALRTVPWWAWIGGLCGATLVFSTLTLVPRIGAAAVLGGLAVGQVVASLLVDKYALVGVQQREFTAGRLIGAVLLLAGIVVFTISTVRMDKPRQSLTNESLIEGD